MTGFLSPSPNKFREMNARLRLVFDPNCHRVVSGCRPGITGITLHVFALASSKDNFACALAPTTQGVRWHDAFRSPGFWSCRRHRIRALLCVRGRLCSMRGVSAPAFWHCDASSMSICCVGHQELERLILAFLHMQTHSRCEFQHG